MDIQDVFRSRPSVGMQTAYYNPSNNLLMEGVVQSTAPSDRLDSTVIVYIPLTRSYVRALVRLGYSSVNNIGISSPLIPGDKVLVQNASGSSSFPTVIGYSNWSSLIPNLITDSSNDLPLPTSVFAGGPPGVSIPEWWQFGGAAHSQVYPVVQQNTQAFQTTAPGAYSLFTPVGDKYSFVPGLTSTFTNSEVKTVLSNTQSLNDTLVANQANVSQVMAQIKSWSTQGGLNYTANSISFNGPTPAVAAQKDRADLNVTYFSYLLEAENDQLDDFDQMIADINSELDCIANASTQTSKKAQSPVNGLLNDLIKLGTSTALQTLNKSLPPQLQLGVTASVNASGQAVISGASVGPITYNSKASTITVNGQQFNLLVNNELASANKLLPSFLQVSPSALGLSVGSLVISTASINPNATQTFPVRPGVVVLNQQGTMYLTMGSNSFNLGSVGTLLVNQSTAKGVSELNQMLPSQLQVSTSTDPATKQPVVNIGPFSLTTAGVNAGLTVDKTALSTTLNNSVSKLFQQLPAPAGALARALWKAVLPSIANTLSSLIGVKKPSVPANQANMAALNAGKTSLNQKIDPCAGTDNSTSPVSSIPPTTIQVPAAPTIQDANPVSNTSLA